ncbi:MAG TPA: hypothetical protein VKB67_11935, partial [Rhizomicrobium sp.]|nr:hypothetical protein [Rhizomicrobium sp.]
QISMNLHGPDVFPHLQAGAVRRPLSSKPKPGESKKVPKFRDDFRYFTRRPRELAGLILPRSAASPSAAPSSACDWISLC